MYCLVPNLLSHSETEAQMGPLLLHALVGLSQSLIGNNLLLLLPPLSGKYFVSYHDLRTLHYLSQGTEPRESPQQLQSHFEAWKVSIPHCVGYIVVIRYEYTTLCRVYSSDKLKAFQSVLTEK
jgi:hypothetical protein